jgi:hypothetical protein
MVNVMILTLTFLGLACSGPDQSRSDLEGYDSKSTLSCRNEDYTLKIYRAGSFFGKNKIVLKKSLFDTVYDEEYKQNWEPTRNTTVEKLATKEMPCSTANHIQLLESKSLTVVQAYPSNTLCEEQGERTTQYVQLNKSSEVLKFTDCKQSSGL